MATAAAAQVPASMRSGIVTCSAAGELVHPVDLDRVGPGALDPRAHRHQERGDVGDLGLTRGVVDHGGAARADRRHHQVLGGADAGVVERDRRPTEPGGLGDEEPVLGSDSAPMRAEARDVQVDGTRPDLIAPGHRHAGSTGPRQQRPEHGGGGAHAAHEFVGGLDRCERRGVDRHGVAVPGHAGAQMLEDLPHREAVLDPGHVAQHGPAGREQRGGHQFEGGVLGAGDDHRPLQARPSRDEEAFHEGISVGADRPGSGLSLPG